MSHIDKMDLVVEDLGSLREAVEALGGELREGQTEFRHYGTDYGERYAGQGMEGVAEADLDKCAHAIHFPHADYEIGVRKREGGGFELAFDAYDSHLSDVVGGEGAPKLKAEYGLARAKKEARRRGHKIRGVERKGGRIRLRVQV